MAQERWRFGVGQTKPQEDAEIKAAHRAGRTMEYAQGQRHARMIEAETARRRARHGRKKPKRKKTEAEVVAPGFDGELAVVGLEVQDREVEKFTTTDERARLPTPQQVAAARRGQRWTRATLAAWGVPWPPPKGWKRDLERWRQGGPRPHGWSSPVAERRIGHGGDVASEVVGP